MDTQRIMAAAKEIGRLTKALEWLRQYGDIFKPEDRESFKLRFTPVDASACVGAPEAMDQVDAAARLHIQRIIKHAIEDAENTIEIHTETIRQEAGVADRQFHKATPPA